MTLLPRIIYLTFVIFLLPATSLADTVTLVSSRDTTLYQGNPSDSDGGSQGMVAGTTGRGDACRALIGFEIAGNIPAGSTITSVQLSLALAVASPTASTGSPIELHALLAAWGEGTAGQGRGPDGIGLGFPTPADGTTATWSHAFYNTIPWAAPGGDFVAAASGSARGDASSNATFTWNSTPAMVSDVQSWLNNPSSNFGWLLLGNELSAGSGLVFYTREAANSAVRPSLAVAYTPPGPTATRLVISAPSGVTAGSPFDITITAQDSNGNVLAGYTGTVAFSSSDAYPGALPANYTFTSSDQGTHTFSGGVTLFSAGSQTLTVQDTANSSLTSSMVVTVVAARASQFVILAPPTVVSGTPFDVTLATVDPYGNVDTSYAGTATWSSSDTDPGVVLPANYSFQATDQGVVMFTAGATLITQGNQTLTATDAVSGITGSLTVAVSPGP
jgi:hypothetical protein